MRKKRTRQKLSVRAISGTHVVMLGINLQEEYCEGLLGFGIHRIDHTEDEAGWLRGMKTFAETDPGFAAGSTYSTKKHPIQGFGWSDYSAKPGHHYTYKVSAFYGTPDALEEKRSVSVDISTEHPEDGKHDIYFNRGVAASQAYARRFTGRSPGEVGSAAYRWLSRGLEEGILEFIERATGPEDSLRVCAYEFHYMPILKALKAASQRGVDVEVIYDHRKNNPGAKNRKAVKAAGLTRFATERRTHSYISHNKFIVRMKGNAAVEVLTGGTNFSESGIFGQSNVSHVVQDPVVAEEYLFYWKQLKSDPPNRTLKPVLDGRLTIPTGLPPQGTTVVFSPRSTTDALAYYAKLAAEANDGLFMTFAFGMHPDIQASFRNGKAPLRYAILEKKTRPMKRGPERTKEEKRIDALRKMKANRFAIGAKLTSGHLDRWVAERLTGLNRNVKYIHNKFMLVDPLTSSPIVVAGSANFSNSSCKNNDENMLVIRGNKRVADIYLGEYMRLFRHHAFREWAARTPARTSGTSLKHLRTDDWWRAYFGDTARSRQRQFFAG